MRLACRVGRSMKLIVYLRYELSDLLLRRCYNKINKTKVSEKSISSRIGKQYEH